MHCSAEREGWEPGAARGVQWGGHRDGDEEVSVSGCSLQY